MSDAPFDETPGRVDIALAIPLRDGQLLVGRRAAGTHLAGLWEFPGGKVEPGEAPEAAARRELGEETGLTAPTLEPLTIVVHDYREAPLRLHVFLVRDPQGEPAVEGGWVWRHPDELRATDMPDANRQILSALRWRLR